MVPNCVKHRIFWNWMKHASWILLGKMADGEEIHLTSDREEDSLVYLQGWDWGRIQPLTIKGGICGASGGICWASDHPPPVGGE